MSSRKKTTTAKATTPRKKTMKVVVNTGTDEHSKRVAQRALPLLTRCKSPPQKQSQDQQMPTLRPVANSLRPVWKTRTPFPDPPKVVTIPEQSDPFEPLDYSPLRNPPPTNIGLLSEVAVAAAAVVNDDCNFSDDDQSKSPPRVAGRKGSLRDDDGEDDESKNPLSIEDSKDPSYRQPEFFEDDELLYSDDNELDASFEEVLDEVARQIEYSDPKKVNHGRRRTKLIAGGPQQPDYAGMNAVEQDMAKAKFQKKTKGLFRQV